MPQVCVSRPPENSRSGGPAWFRQQYHGRSDDPFRRLGHPLSLRPMWVQRGVGGVCLGYPEVAREVRKVALHLSSNAWLPTPIARLSRLGGLISSGPLESDPSFTPPVQQSTKVEL